ncbi:unnamed protein product [Lactuca virosa]|uniref:Uncharacterized protein n=1 Tax=Lactuca virosa TaxID=75947 RepID=A0AAU9MJX5_9ASTR|nr:unnamed protein product [Lactuca virosa]
MREEKHQMWLVIVELIANKVEPVASGSWWHGVKSHGLLAENGGLSVEIAGEIERVKMGRVVIFLLHSVITTSTHSQGLKLTTRENEQWRLDVCFMSAYELQETRRLSKMSLSQVCVP